MNDGIIIVVYMHICLEVKINVHASHISILTKEYYSQTCTLPHYIWVFAKQFSTWRFSVLFYA